MSENYYPAWRATVDGRGVPVARADFTFIGVPLPTGARRVDLTFEQASYRLGRTLTLIAMALSVAMVAGGVVLERRARG